MLTFCHKNCKHVLPICKHLLTVLYERANMRLLATAYTLQAKLLMKGLLLHSEHLKARKMLMFQVPDRNEQNR